MQPGNDSATIRRLAPEEWAILRENRLRALRDAPSAFGSTYGEEAQRPDSWWANSVDTLAWFVAEEEGRVIGLAAGLPAGDDHSCPEVISMWVEAHRRGSGTGQQLLTAVMEWARHEGATQVSLAVADGNERARRFYEKNGFVATGSTEPLRSRPEVCTHEMVLELGTA